MHNYISVGINVRRKKLIDVHVDVIINLSRSLLFGSASQNRILRLSHVFDLWCFFLNTHSGQGMRHLHLERERERRRNDYDVNYMTFCVQNFSLYYLCINSPFLLPAPSLETHTFLSHAHSPFPPLSLSFTHTHTLSS